MKQKLLLTTYKTSCKLKGVVEKLVMKMSFLLLDYTSRYKEHTYFFAQKPHCSWLNNLQTIKTVKIHLKRRNLPLNRFDYLYNFISHKKQLYLIPAGTYHLS